VKGHQTPAVRYPALIVMAMAQSGTGQVSRSPNADRTVTPMTLRY